MTIILSMILPCMLAMQVSAEAPLFYTDILAKVRPTTQWRLDSKLAEWQLQLQDSRGFLREGPTLSFEAGPRRTPGAPNSTDKGVEVELPLFLSLESQMAALRRIQARHRITAEIQFLLP